MKKLGLFFVCGLMCVLMSSCNIYRHNMKEANAFVEYHAEDFTLSDQVTGEASVVRVLGVDWEHLFGTTKSAHTPSFGTVIPVIGNVFDNGANYALFDMMKKNPGYDVVIYPQVEAYRHAPVLGTDLYSKTTYKVTARLGKLKK